MLVETLVKFALLGSSWVLYILIALSVVSFAAMFERWIFFRKNSRASGDLRSELEKAVLGDDEAAVRTALEKSSTVQARALKDALPFIGGGSTALLDAVESTLGRERGRMDTGMTMLATLGNNAPFVGLFGTVLGVIEAFAHLGTGDQSQMGGVMSGIADALVATGVGIFVAIPAVVAYNICLKKVGEIENEINSLAKLLAAWVAKRDRSNRPHVVAAEVHRLEKHDEGARTGLR